MLTELLVLLRSLTSAGRVNPHQTLPPNSPTVILLEKHVSSALDGRYSQPWRTSTAHSLGTSLLVLWYSSMPNAHLGSPNHTVATFSGCHINRCITLPYLSRIGESSEAQILWLFTGGLFLRQRSGGRAKVRVRKRSSTYEICACASFPQRAIFPSRHSYL
jgi:hypothetical protein